jgi:hypothetical protein
MRCLHHRFVSILVLFLPSAILAQSPMDANPGGKTDLKLGALIGYNFNGDQSWANLQPEVFAGFDQSVGGRWRLRVGPSVASGGVAEDTTSFFRSLTLPGQANITALIYYDTSPQASAGASVYAGLGLGLKAVSRRADSLKTVAQHNIRLAAGIRFKKFLVLASQYSIGWHNITNESEKAYKAIFATDKTRLEYIMISLQAALPGKDAWIDVTWRAITNTSLYPSFAAQNRLLSIGIRKDLSLVNAPALQ